MMVRTPLPLELTKTEQSLPVASRRQGSFEDWVNRQSGPPIEDTAESHGPAEANGLQTSSTHAASTEAALVPGAGGVLMLELQVRDANGAEQLIAAPWSLMGSARLAQETSAVRPMPGLPGAATNIGGAAGSPSATLVGGAPNALSTQAFLAANVASRHAANLWNVPQGRNTSASAPSELRHLQPHAPSIAASQVAARLMRWFDDQQQLSTVWIRDYRLDEAGIGSLAQALRQMTSAEGLELQRIVVNGREVWRAPDTSTQPETQPCL